MTRPENLAVRVLRAPRGLPQPGDFQVEPVEISTPRDGEVVFRACYLYRPERAPPATRRRLRACDLVRGGNSWQTHTSHALRPVLRKRLRIQGFVVQDHYDEYPVYRELALGHIAAGRLRNREDVIAGIENAPRALADVLTSRNQGQQLIRIGELPDALRQ